MDDQRPVIQTVVPSVRLTGNSARSRTDHVAAIGKPGSGECERQRLTGARGQTSHRLCSLGDGAREGCDAEALSLRALVLDNNSDGYCRVRWAVYRQR